MNDRTESKMLYFVLGVLVGMVLAYRSRGKLIMVETTPEARRIMQRRQA